MVTVLALNTNKSLSRKTQSENTQNITSTTTTTQSESPLQALRKRATKVLCGRDISVAVFEKERFVYIATSSYTSLDSHKYDRMIELKEGEEYEAILSEFRSKYLCFEDILSVELRVDDDVVTKRSATNIVGRAVVGGILTGGVGAVIGGVTGKSTSKKFIKSIKVVIITANLENPTKVLTYYRNNKPTSEGDNSNYVLSIASEVAGLLSAVIEKTERETAAKSIVQPQTLSSVDEIMKSKELLDQGIITQEEFEQLKAKILNK